VTGNQIRRNRGKENGTAVAPGEGLFIDLEGTNGFGNADPDVQGGIDAPALNDAGPGDVTRTHADGTGVVGATVYIFRTSGVAGESPSRINAFVDTATVNGSGAWSANFPQIPTGQRLTALQIDTSGNASELALAVTP
jgi:hypothetical protein